ncbi:ABC transporter ATP-binding protein [Georgenia alba]|uniref:ABC transporter ATP-binding protein n=1 Tax=Georgenia alba TaxID=2233858 RepID=A0ABW2Q692_9MICO
MRPLPRPIGRGRRLLLLGLVAIGVGQAAGAVALARIVQWVFDRLVTEWAAGTVSSLTPGELTLLVAGPLAAVLTTAACRAAERVTAERLGQRYVTEVRDLLFDHLTTVPARSIRGRRSGSLLMRFVGDLNALRSWVSLGLARMIVAGVAVSLVVVMLALIAPGLTIAVAVVLALGAAVTVLTSHRLVVTSRRARKRRARLAGEVSERLTHVGVLQTGGQGQRERRRVGRKSRRVAEAMVARARAAGAARAVAEATAGLATVAVVFVGALEVHRGSTSPGAVVGALAVVGLLAAYLRDLGRVAEYASGARVAREAARRFLALEPLADDPTQPDVPPGGGHLELRDVHLEPGVKGVSVEARPGQVVAIVGPNGAGKSSLVALAARLVDPDRGAVSLDGAGLREVNLESLRREVGVMSPDLPLIGGTVRRNVTYRHPKATLPMVVAVFEACGLAPVIESLPRRWESDVGESGRLLSSGQRARVELARAMLGDPRLLVLDEADAHLDHQTRDILTAAVLARRGTTLVITHRRDLVRIADVVWHLEDGRLLEEGPPERLLGGDGPTARLFREAAPGDVVGSGRSEGLPGGGAR